MLQKSVPSLIGALLLLSLGNSFPLWASSHEKDPKDCEVQLRSGAVLKAHVEAQTPVLVEARPIQFAAADENVNIQFASRFRVRIMPVGALPPIEQELDPYLYRFRGADGLHLAAWADRTQDAPNAVWKLSLGDNMDQPFFSLPLEPGEEVESYQAIPGSEDNGFVAVLTGRRILLIKYSLN